MRQGVTLIAAFGLMLSASACDRVAHNPSVLLITIDTLRFDRLSTHDPMPTLRSMADRAVELRQARATVPMTLPSHATLLTGATSDVHGVRDNVGYALGSSIPTLAESFANAGYATAAFVGGYPLVRAFGLDRGFQTYDDHLDRTVAGPDSGHVERRAADVLAAAKSWIAAHAEDRFFVWVHLYDLHEPYEPPSPFADPESPYDGEAAYVDACLSDFFDQLDDARIDPLIVVTSDHGESLGEHGERTHGIFLYDSTLHVPLLFRLPGTDEHRVVDDAVSLADVAPTLLDLVGLPALDGATGRSLATFLHGSESDDLESSPIYLESLHGRQRYGWSELHGFFEWPWKFIEAPQPELYDLDRDPDETTNVIDDATLDEMRARLQALRRAPTGEVHPNAADLKALESLGYLGSRSTAVPTEAESQRTDPKQVIGVLPAIEAGLAAMAVQRFGDAERELLAALEADPRNLVALNNLGIIAFTRGRNEEAAAWFERGLAEDPTSDHLANNLGLALSRQGRHAEAEEAYRRALASNPAFDIVHFNLALTLHRTGRQDDALAELERYAANHPEDPRIEPVRQAIREQQLERERGEHGIGELRGAEP